MQGYTHPADCTGLTDAYDSWRSEQVVASCDWTTRDVDGANALLDQAGYAKDADGTRTLPDGSPFAFDISVGSTSSDWLSVANIISQNLADVGVNAKVNSPDWSAVVASYEDGSFDTGIVWSNAAPTPYQYYRGVMSTETVIPVGEQTFQNYHRFGLPGSRLTPRRVRRCLRPNRSGGGHGPAAGVVRRERAGRAALPGPEVGRVQHHAVHRFP